jgi:hypothetical protein
MRHFLKRYLSILIFSALTIFLSFKSLTNPIYISGHLKKNPTDSSAYISPLDIFVLGDNKLLAKATTGKNGEFKLTFTPANEKTFDFYCVGMGVDTMLLSSIKSFASDTPDISFYIPGRQKRNIQGKIICPKCEKADKVYVIRYGDNPISVRTISKSGDTTYSP